MIMIITIIRVLFYLPVRGEESRVKFRFPTIRVIRITCEIYREDVEGESRKPKDSCGKEEDDRFENR